MNLWYHLDKTPGGRSVGETVALVFEKNAATGYVMILTAMVGAAFYLSSRTQHGREDKGDSRDAEARKAGRVIVSGLAHVMAVLVFLLTQKRVFDFYVLLLLPGLVVMCGGFLSLSQIDPPKKIATLLGLRLEAGILILALFCFAQPLIPLKHRLFVKTPIHYWGHEARTVDALVEWGRELPATWR